MLNEVIPIFFTIDDNYSPFVATSITSICSNTQRECEFIVLDGGISEENKEKILDLKRFYKNFSINFVKIDAEKYFKDFIVTQYLSLAVYYRFLIPILFPDIAKVLYLDVDIIAKGDIGILYDVDLNNYIIGAAKDGGDINWINKLKCNMNMNINSTYFNAGILIIDFEKWRKQNVTNELFNIEKLYHEKLICCDQDILNKYFENNYKLIEPRYNSCQNGKDILIRHYYGALKPWQVHPDLCTDEYAEFIDFWNIAKRTLFYEELINKCKYKNLYQLKMLKVIQKNEYKNFING